MRKNFGRHMRVLMYVIFAIFLVGSVYYFGSYTGPAREQAGGEAQNVIATVNGAKIGRERFDGAFTANYERWDQMGLATLENLEQMRWSVFDGLADLKLLVAAAQNEGINVSGRDLRQEINRRVDETLAGVGARARENRDLRRRLEDSIRRRREEIREEILVQRLREMIGERVRVTDQELRDRYVEVRARHILVRAAPTEKDGRSDAEAKEKAEQILAQLKDGGDFAAVAREVSEDQATAVKGGDLGYFKQGQMTPEFEKAALDLVPGQMSDVVKTPFGYHIIKVEDVRYDLPDDFEENKKEYREQYLEQRRSQAWEQLRRELREQAKIEIRDPELRGIKAMMDGKTDEAIGYFADTLDYAPRLGDQVHAAIYYSLGKLYGEKGDWKQAAEYYERALDVAVSSLASIYLALGDAYRELDKRDKALEYYDAAEDEAPQDYRVRQRLLVAYQRLGEQEATARQQEWIAEEDRRRQAEWQERMEEMARQAAQEAQGEANAPQAGEGSPR